MSAAEPDVYERQLDAELERLAACQNEHDVKSCSECEHFIGCETRQTYVNAVYNSMSKGDTGGFEF